MPSIDYKYAMHQVVKVVAIKEKARIISCSTTPEGQKYYVVWWCDGVRKDEWLFEWELE